MSQSEISCHLQENKRLAFVQASWHEDIVSQSQVSFFKAMHDVGITEDKIDLFTVPGSLEIPLYCKKLALTGDYQIIIAAGLIVDGGIYRHDFVSSSVLNGMMQVQLEMQVPILSIVLTPHHFNSQSEHEEFFYHHFKKKGVEAAQACCQLLNDTLLNW